MCGICGFTGAPDEPTLRSMLKAIEHRGPDAEGVYIDRHVSLGNRRLSIVDVEGGDQPIFNETNDIVVVYNGEIYNVPELRSDLEGRGHRFQTRTDTEVLVHLYEEYGDEFAVRLNGMFAFALWDTRRHRLLIARDQVGIKPLCYTWNGRTLVFGSEAKAILRHPNITAELDIDSAHLLLNFRFVPSPRTLFRNIHKLPAGHLLVWEGGEPIVRRYWTWDEQPDTSVAAREWPERFRHTLEAAVGRQLVADVPVGAFLSGGLDSSSIVAAASTVSGQTLRTFSLGFDEPTDELDDAQVVANAFGTDHTSEILAPNPLAEFPRTIYHVEEPKVNALQGYFVSRLASRSVKVALSGLGGDELFAGYDIHRHLRTVDLCRRLVPAWMSRAMSNPIDAISGWGQRSFGLPFENPRRGLEILSRLHEPGAAYGILRNVWDLDDRALSRVYTPSAIHRISARSRELLEPRFGPAGSPVDQALTTEFNLKMVDDFLHNEDRVSMANSLEVRVPFLDREMVSLALRMPLAQRFPRGRCKAVIKDAMSSSLPKRILRKRKWGFTFNPYHQFKKDLRSIARSVLTPENLEKLDLIDPRFVQQILEHPPTPRMRWHYFMLWMIVGLHFWHEIFIEGADFAEIGSEQATVAPTC